VYIQRELILSHVSNGDRHTGKDPYTRSQAEGKMREEYLFSYLGMARRRAISPRPGARCGCEFALKECGVDRSQFFKGEIRKILTMLAVLSLGLMYVVVTLTEPTFLVSLYMK
jgi:hypothetical protein